MLRGIWRDPKRFKETYWGNYKDTYFAGDGAHRDKNGYFWIMGRVDDVMNVSGHRIGTTTADDALVRRLKQHVTKEIGAIARPTEIRFTNALPKTRSGKIMRRLLRDIASGKEVAGDTSTLEDLSVLAKLRESNED